MLELGLAVMHLQIILTIFGETAADITVHKPRYLLPQFSLPCEASRSTIVPSIFLSSLVWSKVLPPHNNGGFHCFQLRERHGFHIDLADDVCRSTNFFDQSRL
jgi:hypothetical protein